MPRAAFTIATKNAPDVARRLRAFDTRTRAAIKTLIGETAAKQFQRTYDLCPKRTFFMADHIKVEFSRGGYRYTVGWKESDFVNAGKPFYPLWQEFGFRHYRTGRFIQNASLFPARNAVLRDFQRQLASILRRSAGR